MNGALMKNRLVAKVKRLNLSVTVMLVNAQWNKEIEHN